MAIARMIPLLLALMVIVAPATEAALTCSQVTGSILPCLTYLTGGALSASCCSGVKSLAAAASTAADRQAACRCLKSAAGGVSGINPDNAAGLLGKCGVRIPYKISPSAECDSVK